MPIPLREQKIIKRFSSSSTRGIDFFYLNFLTKLENLFFDRGERKTNKVELCFLL